MTAREIDSAVTGSSRRRAATLALGGLLLTGGLGVTPAFAQAGPGTDLSLDKTGPQGVFVGGTITWTITVTSVLGPSGDYEVHDPIPAGVNNVSTSTAGCSVVNTPGGPEVYCLLGGSNPGGLNQGDSYVITVTASATGSTSIVNNVASVAVVGGDVSTRNNSDDHVTDVTPVAGAPLANPVVAGLAVVAAGAGALTMRRRRTRQTGA